MIILCGIVIAVAIAAAAATAASIVIGAQAKAAAATAAAIHAGHGIARMHGANRCKAVAARAASAKGVASIDDACGQM